MTAQFTTPIEDRYFEDYVAGSVREFDPQPFHIDRAALNQCGEVVMSVKTMNMLRARER